MSRVFVWLSLDVAWWIHDWLHFLSLSLFILNTIFYERTSFTSSNPLFFLSSLTLIQHIYTTCNKNEIHTLLQKYIIYINSETELGPKTVEGEEVFAVAHLFASFNDTFVHVTDLSGRETLVRVTGGMKVKADRDESSPYAAMLAAQDVAARCKELGVTALHVKIRGTGGNKSRSPGPGGQSALRALARNGMKIGRIEDVTPIPSDSTRRKSGRRGRRL